MLFNGAAHVRDQVEQNLLPIFALTGVVFLDLSERGAIESLRGLLEVLIELLYLLLISQIVGVQLNKLERVCFLGSDVNFLISGVRFSKTDVSLDVCVE